MWPVPPLGLNFEAALRDASSTRPTARTAAANRLGSPPEGDEAHARARDALVRLVADAQASVRYAATLSLGSLRDPSVIDQLLDRMNDSDVAVRQAAIIAVANVGGERAIEALHQGLTDARPEIRFQSVVSYAELCPERAAEHLVPLLRDDDPEVRANTAAALGALGDTSTADAIVRLLDDSDESTREEAALALAKLGDMRAARVLRRSLAVRDRALAAAMALGELGATSAVDDLYELGTRRLVSSLVRAAAGGALVRIGDPRGTEILRAVLRGFRSEGKSYAVEMAGELELVDLLDDLVALGRRPRNIDQDALSETIAKLTARREAMGK